MFIQADQQSRDALQRNRIIQPASVKGIHVRPFSELYHFFRSFPIIGTNEDVQIQRLIQVLSQPMGRDRLECRYNARL